MTQLHSPSNNYTRRHNNNRVDNHIYFTLWEVNMAHISLKSPRKLGLVGKISVMALILLPPGYATDQSGTTFSIVSHRNAMFYEPRP